MCPGEFKSAVLVYFHRTVEALNPENRLLFAGQCSGTHHSQDRQCLHGNPVTFVAGQVTPPALMYTDSLGLEPKDLLSGCIL